MSDYFKINLCDLIDSLGESKVKSILSSFSSPNNEDVEFFIKNKAIEFSKQGLAQTHLDIYKNEDGVEILGYYAIANKPILIDKKSLSNTLAKKISKFASVHTKDTYIVQSLLIGQLSKNFKDGNECLMTGEELLDLAIESVQEAQKIIGGKVVFLECEDKPKLVDFYSKYGFVVFGKRMLDRDEVEKVDGKYYLQWIKYC